MNHKQKILSFQNNKNQESIPIIEDLVTPEVVAFLNVNTEIFMNRMLTLCSILESAMKNAAKFPEFSCLEFDIDTDSIYAFITKSTHAELCGLELNDCYTIADAIDDSGIKYRINVKEQINNQDEKALYIDILKDIDNSLYILDSNFKEWIQINPWMTDDIKSYVYDNSIQGELVRLIISQFDPEYLSHISGSVIQNTITQLRPLLDLVGEQEGLLTFKLYQNQVLAVPSDEYHFGIAIRLNDQHKSKFDICLYLDDSDDMQEFYNDGEEKEILFQPSISGLSIEEVRAYIKEYIDRSSSDRILYTLPFSDDCIIQTRKDMENEKIFNQVIKPVEYEDSPYTDLVKQIRNFLVCSGFEGEDEYVK